MIKKIEQTTVIFLQGIFLSYSQVFFSKQKTFAVILIIVTFFDWISGFSGLIAVATANLVALLIGFNRHSVSQGYYGFNSLMVGLGMGLFYQPGIEFFVIVIFASIFTFFLTIWFQGIFWKYGLPYLSWPFLFSIWLVSLASKEFTVLAASDRGVFMLNEIYRYGGIQMVRLYYWVNDLPIHESILVYFKSLAAIFFQYNLLAGILVAIGLLIYSRIAFLLSVIGFFSAWYFYLLLGADLTDLSYSYIGFNFIFTAIAIGGFFIVPSRWALLWVVLLTPIIAIIISSAGVFFDLIRLPIYSLAFNIVVLIFLYVLKLRESHFYQPELVNVQRFSPERNLYGQHNYKSRFDVKAILHIILPFLDEWTVTQGHNGEHTHRDDWRHAWDFEIFDKNGNCFSENGYQTKDYYCYGKPVLAPADGMIQEIRDGIPDNSVGEMNLGSNWGNTIVIKHADNIYSKVSHLKPGTIKTFKGAYVKRGEVIAYSGNSGRSPAPHLHFQLQSDPFIGSKTIDFPIANYLLKTDNGYELKTYERPAKGQVITNVMKNDSLTKAFAFIPGQTISFEIAENDGKMRQVHWEVKSDMYNYTYLECRSTSSKAYFYNEGNLFYFTHFEGKKNCFLYYFYLGAYKIVLGYYSKLVVTDSFPLHAFKTGIMLLFQDFIAPFYIFMKGRFELKYLKLEDNMISSTISMTSSARLVSMKRLLKKIDFDLVISNGRIESFAVKGKDFSIKAKEIKS